MKLVSCAPVLDAYKLTHKAINIDNRLRSTDKLTKDYICTCKRYTNTFKYFQIVVNSCCYRSKLNYHSINFWWKLYDAKFKSLYEEIAAQSKSSFASQNHKKYSHKDLPM